MEQERQIVIQSNPLIEAQYRLDLVPQKLLRYVISMITPSDTINNRKYYRVNISEFEKYIGRQIPSGKIFEDIRRVAEILKSTKIKIVKQDTTIETSWIASFEYPRNKGWIEFEISGKLETELFQLKKQFTQYYLQNISKLRYMYSIRIYELLRQYIQLGKREIGINDLKAILGIGDEYKLYGKFKQVVLEPSIAEILLKTDIDFKWDEKKESRKVVAILFYDICLKTIIPAAILALLLPEQKESKQVIRSVQKFIESNGEEYVKEKIIYTNSRNPENWNDYFVHACEKNYGEGYTPENPDTAQEKTSEAQNIKDGAGIEISGKKYLYEDGFVMTEKGVIPSGVINQMLKSGEAKLISE
ncbi:MAG TPA: replication initiation protein [Bacteroidales bacterium]|nr:replication initiation protein [Bacteroidales bacterium]